MKPKTVQLAKALSEVIPILEDDGLLEWAEFVNQARDNLLGSEYLGAKIVLAAYDGESMFKTISISQKLKNERFCDLRAKIGDLAGEIVLTHEEHATA